VKRGKKDLNQKIMIISSLVHGFGQGSTEENIKINIHRFARKYYNKNATLKEKDR